MRVLLYSHDSWGLGHLRRSLAIASALTARFEDVNVLLITGSPCATQFPLPSNCDVLKLPSISKNGRGEYVPRSISEDISDTLELRTRLILVSYETFQPHCLIVDHKLTGLRSEALPMLKRARADGRALIYGMRDVLDTPEAVAAEWKGADCQWALTEGYDRICVYGNRELFDPCAHYPQLEAVRQKISFSGYVVRPRDGSVRQPVPLIQPNVLVTVGGGEDGTQRIEAYLDALALRPAGWTSRIITGPLMDRGRVREYRLRIQRLGLSEQVRISRFHSNVPRLLQSSDAVVSMAGYNSCAEILQSRIPAVYLPRIHPRREQLIRARRLQELGLASCLDTLEPKRLRAAVEHSLSLSHIQTNGISLNGLERFCDIVLETMTARSQPFPTSHRARDMRAAV